MTSWTYSGDFQMAHTHLPFAKTRQMVMNNLGHTSHNIQINASDSAVVRPGHIHITAGTSGYEFYANEGGFVQSGGALGRFFKEGVEEAAPVVLNPAAPEYDVNMWHYSGGFVTGGLARRYHTTEPLWVHPGLEPPVFIAKPVIFRGGVAQLSGDKSVMAAALLNGYLIGIGYSGEIYAWDNSGVRILDTVLPAPTWGSDTDTYGAHWVFNKAGNQCVGITFRSYIGPPPGNKPNSELTIKPHITVVDWFETGGVITFNVTKSVKLDDSTFAADYNYTSEGNELITASFDIFDYTVGQVPNPDPPLDFLDAQDVELVIKEDSSGAELVREMVNYNSSWSNGPVLGTDKTKDSFDGSLFALDLRYLMYLIFISERVIGLTVDQFGTYRLVNKGRVVFESNNWIDLPAIKTGAGNASNLPLARLFNNITHKAHSHPIGDAVAVYVRAGFSVPELDFMYSGGSFVFDYHQNAYGAVTANTNLKLSGTWISGN